jgi:hypothetical protein
MAIDGILLDDTDEGDITTLKIQLLGDDEIMFTVIDKRFWKAVSCVSLDIQDFQKALEVLEPFRITMRAPETATQDALLQDIMEIARSVVYDKYYNPGVLERALRERLFR